jgi:hypothetical protein
VRLVWKRLTLSADHRPLLEVLKKAELKPLAEYGDSAAAIQQRDLDYGIRRFEIETMTFALKSCKCCGYQAVTPGVVIGGGTDAFPCRLQQRKYVYRDRSDGGKLLYLAAQRKPFLDQMHPACKFCIDAVKNKMQPKFAPSGGFAHGRAVPAVLKDLSFAEEALIAQIQPVMAAKILKFGMRSASGHVAFVDRGKNIIEVATVLPRLAEDVAVISLDRQTKKGARPNGPIKFVELRCRRDKVQAALNWLKAHSPAYANVVISAENLNKLPQGGQLQVRSVDLNEEEEEEEECGGGEDRGPAPMQGGGAGAAAAGDGGYIEATHSGTVTGSAPAAAGLHGRITGALDHLRNRAKFFEDDSMSESEEEEEEKEEEEKVGHRFQQRFSTSAPLSWRDVSFFFAKAWPTVFMPTTDGTDVPAEFSRAAPRHHSLRLFEYARYLMNHESGRYSAHPSLKFALLNMKHREQLSASTSFGVKQMDDAEPLDRKKERERAYGGF